MGGDCVTRTIHGQCRAKEAGAKRRETNLLGDEQTEVGSGWTEAGVPGGSSWLSRAGRNSSSIVQRPRQASAGKGARGRRADGQLSVAEEGGGVSDKEAQVFDAGDSQRLSDATRGRVCCTERARSSLGGSWPGAGGELEAWVEVGARGGSARTSLLVPRVVHAPTRVPRRVLYAVLHARVGDKGESSGCQLCWLMKGSGWDRAVVASYACRDKSNLSQRHCTTSVERIRCDSRGRARTGWVVDSGCGLRVARVARGVCGCG